jgi:hypothetical protein
VNDQVPWLAECRRNAGVSDRDWDRSKTLPGDAVEITAGLVIWWRGDRAIDRQKMAKKIS